MKTYLKHRIENVIDVKELVISEYLDFEGKYKDYSEKHNFWEICYVESGTVALFTDGKEKILSAGDLAAVAPMTEHSYKSESGNKNKAFVVCFECFSQSVKSLAGTVFSLNKSLIDCIKKIIYESRETFHINENELLEVNENPAFGGQQATILQLEYLLINLIRDLSSKKDSAVVFLKSESFYRDLTSAILDYLNENIGKRLFLKDICAKFNYSKSFICKIFKEQTGESLFAYFNRIKVDESERLLDETNLSVSEISALFGFSEIKYFGALFKKVTGLTPSQYRERRGL